MNHRVLFWFPTVIVVLSGCHDAPEKALLELAPNLDPKMAQALVAQDTVWDCHCRDAGLVPTLTAADTLRHAVDTRSEAGYFSTRERLRPYVERVERCLSEHYKFEGEWTEYEAWLARSLQEAKALDSLTTELIRLGADTTFGSTKSGYQRKLSQFEELERGFRSCRSVPGVVLALEAQAHLYDALNDSSKSLAYFRKALAEREAGGRHTLTMSLLTTIGYVLGHEGNVDSKLACYNRALQMAEESHDPQGTAHTYRLLSFHFQANGQYGTAYDLLMRSAERCKEFKGDTQEFLTLLNLLNMQARFEVWDTMDELLERADYLLAQTRESPGNGYSTRARERMEVEFGLIRGRYLIATGREQLGLQLFASLRDPARRCTDREKPAQLLYAWSSALLSTHKPQEAAQLAREGLAYADSNSANLPMEAVRLNLVLADASCRLGNFKECRHALANFRALVGQYRESESRDRWISHDRILVSLAMASGNYVQAEQNAAMAMARLERFVRDMDQSAQACLFLDESRPLRESIHEILKGDPEAGYGFEMAWRSLYRTMGSDPSDRPSFFAQHRQFKRQCADLGRTMLAQVARAGAVHAVYFAGSDSLWRWTASSAGLKQEAVPISPSEIKRRVSIVTQSLASEASLKKEAIAYLTDLKALLPSNLPTADRRLFLVSPDLYLANLPFEAINVAENGYRPLIESCDIAYLRHTQPHVSPPDAYRAGLIVASPAYPPALVRRYPLLKTLPYGAREADLVSTSFPQSTYLSGAVATKQDLQAKWERPPGFIYVSSHFIQDTGTPYLSFLPLAGPEDAEAGEALLDYGEIRSANLAGCALVVLSGCATGAAYTNNKGAAPSLGDAFLDAGAHAVVYTRWRVQDDACYNLARAFIGDWSRGESPITALNQAQREAWRSARQPSTTWTSYSISLSQIPSIETPHVPSIETHHAQLLKN